MGLEHRVELGAAPPDLSDEGRAGWEIGRLWMLLRAGATQVDGADPVRVRRVRAVLAKLDAASELDAP